MSFLKKKTLLTAKGGASELLLCVNFYILLTADKGRSEMLRFHPAGFREAVFCVCRVGVGGPPFWPRERRSKVRRTPGTRDERERERERERRRERVCKEGKAFAAGDATSSSAPFFLFFFLSFF